MDDVYGELKPLMFSIAYRMLGSATEAEDIVQEAFLRFHKETSGGTEVDSAKAYLSAVTTRLSIDHLRSARVRRERYVGTWLPEPILTEEEDDVALHAETADSLSMGFLVLLESLTPVERAVFLLREVFDYGFDEIARIVGKTEENCRQISVRARKHVHDAKPRFEASRARKEELARRFFAAAMDGDLEGLLEMLAADAVAYADGGGLAPASRRPVHGGKKVANLLLGSFTRYTETSNTTFAPTHFNQFEVYVNDQWRITPRLSLTLGLRYQYIPWPLADQRNIVGFDPSRFDPNKAPASTNIVSGAINLKADPTGQQGRTAGGVTYSRWTSNC